MMNRKEDEKMRKEKRQINRLKVNCIFVMGIVLIMVAAIVICYFFLIKDSSKFEGKYYELSSPEDPSYYEIIPDKVNPMEGSYYLKNDTNEDFDAYQTEFVYHIEEGKVVMSGGTAYTFYKNYLIPEKYTYSGYIPDEDNFDAICEYTSKTGSGEKIEFKKDGTLESTYYDEDETQITLGTYERSGDIITCKYEDAWSSKYLVYKNQINSSVLYKKD